MSVDRRPVFQVAFAGGLVVAIGLSLVAAPGFDGLAGGLLAAAMLTIAIVDARRYLIPNELVAAALVLALLRAALTGEDAGFVAVAWTMLRATATALPFWLLLIGYRRWRGRDGLGLGDVKLAAVAGAWLGWTTIFVVIELATLAALAGYALNGVLRNRPLHATAMLPFGLFLAPAIWIGWWLETLLAGSWSP